MENAFLFRFFRTCQGGGHPDTPTSRGVIQTVPPPPYPPRGVARAKPTLAQYPTLGGEKKPTACLKTKGFPQTPGGGDPREGKELGHAPPVEASGRQGQRHGFSGPPLVASRPA